MLPVIDIYKHVLTVGRAFLTLASQMSHTLVLATKKVCNRQLKCQFHTSMTHEKCP